MAEQNVQDLMRILSSGFRPNAPSPASRPASSVDFGELLDRARQGQVRTGLTVTIDPDLNLKLQPERAEQLSTIADVAQAQGLEKVLVNDGGRHYLLDVEARVLRPAPPADEHGLVTGIDASIDLSLSTGSVEEGQPASATPGNTLLQALTRHPPTSN